MKRADVERKFRGNVGGRWPQERTASILQALWTLDRAEDVAILLGRLSLPAHP
jgi:2-methylcitrate dehydratase